MAFSAPLCEPAFASFSPLATLAKALLAAWLAQIQEHHSLILWQAIVYSPIQRRNLDEGRHHAM
jgi:hypothetical protein